MSTLARRLQSLINARLDGGETRASPEDPSTSLSNPAPWLVDLFGGAAAASGVRVTSESAMGIPAVWAAVNFISRTIAALPLQVYREKDGGRETLDDLPIRKLLHDAPGPELTSFQWRDLAMSHVLLEGRHYSVIVRDRGQRISELRPLDPSKVSPKRIDGRMRYEVRLGSGGTEVFTGADIIDIPWRLKRDGVRHVAPISRLKDSLGLAVALEQYGSRFFANDARPSVVMEVPGKMNETATANLAKSVAEKFSGIENKFRVMVLEEGAKLHIIGVEPEHAQFLDSRRFQIEEVSRIYNIPPAFLHDLTHGTFSNTEQQDLQFLKHSMLQWILAWEQQLNLKLFGKRKEKCAFNADGIVRADFKTMVEGLSSEIQNAMLSPNEARALMHRAKKDGGDDLMIQMNMSKIGALGQMPAAKERTIPDD